MDIETTTTSNTDRLIFIVTLITTWLASKALDTFLGLSGSGGALRVTNPVKYIFCVICASTCGAEIYCILTCCTGILAGLTYTTNSSIPTWAWSNTLRWITFFFEKQRQALINTTFRASCGSADACRTRALAKATCRSWHWFVKSFCTLSHASVLTIDSEWKFSRALKTSTSIANITEVKALCTRWVTTNADFVRITVRSGAITTARLTNTALIIKSVEILSFDLIRIFQPTRRANIWIIRQARTTREHTIK